MHRSTPGGFDRYKWSAFGSAGIRGYFSRSPGSSRAIRWNASTRSWVNPRDRQRSRPVREFDQHASRYGHHNCPLLSTTYPGLSKGPRNRLQASVHDTWNRRDGSTRGVLQLLPLSFERHECRTCSNPSCPSSCLKMRSMRPSIRWSSWTMYRVNSEARISRSSI